METAQKFSYHNDPFINSLLAYAKARTDLFEANRVLKYLEPMVGPDVKNAVEISYETAQQSRHFEKQTLTAKADVASHQERVRETRAAIEEFLSEAVKKRLTTRRGTYVLAKASETQYYGLHYANGEYLLAAGADSAGVAASIEQFWKNTSDPMNQLMIVSS